MMAGMLELVNQMKTLHEGELCTNEHKPGCKVGSHFCQLGNGYLKSAWRNIGQSLQEKEEIVERMSATNIHVVIFIVQCKRLKNLDSLRSSESYFLYTCRVLLCNAINSKLLSCKHWKYLLLLSSASKYTKVITAKGYAPSLSRCLLGLVLLLLVCQ